MGCQLEAVTKEHQTHTLYTLGMTYCETLLKGKGSYDHAIKIVDQLFAAFPQSIHDITPQLVNDFKLKRLQTVKPATCRIQLAFMCSGLMKPDTHLGENARQIEVSDDQTTPLLYS